MKEDSKSTETTSRRAFTKAAVTAAVAAPIGTSLASCANEAPQNSSGQAAAPKVQASPTPTGDVHKLDGDPPIIVGGGGSTWVWIRREANLQFFDPAHIPSGVTPPDPDITPNNVSLYYLMRLGNLTLTDVHFRPGEGANEGNHNIPNTPNGKKKHRTFFNGVFEP